MDTEQEGNSLPVSAVDGLVVPCTDAGQSSDQRYEKTEYYHEKADAGIKTPDCRLNAGRKGRQ